MARPTVHQVPAPRVALWIVAVPLALRGVGTALWFMAGSESPTSITEGSGADPPISAPPDPFARGKAQGFDTPPTEPIAGGAAQRPSRAAEAGEALQGEALQEDPSPGILSEARPSTTEPTPELEKRQATSAAIPSPPSDPTPKVGADPPPWDDSRSVTARRPQTPGPSDVARHSELQASDERLPGTDAGNADSLSQTTPTPDVASRTEPTLEGLLVLFITPWAEVLVDGESRGTTPFEPLKLTPGEHAVVLQHPSYEPLPKNVMIRAGKPTELEVDLSSEAFPKIK